MKDRQGKMRGKCHEASCECEDYEWESGPSACSYCEHSAVKHELIATATSTATPRSATATATPSELESDDLISPIRGPRPIAATVVLKTAPVPVPSDVPLSVPSDSETTDDEATGGKGLDLNDAGSDSDNQSGRNSPELVVPSMRAKRSAPPPVAIELDSDVDDDEQPTAAASDSATDDNNDDDVTAEQQSGPPSPLSAPPSPPQPKPVTKRNTARKSNLPLLTAAKKPRTQQVPPPPPPPPRSTASTRMVSDDDEDDEEEDDAMETDAAGQCDVCTMDVHMNPVHCARCNTRVRHVKCHSGTCDDWMCADCERICVSALNSTIKAGIESAVEILGAKVEDFRDPVPKSNVQYHAMVTKYVDIDQILNYCEFNRYGGVAAVEDDLQHLIDNTTNYFRHRTGGKKVIKHAERFRQQALHNIEKKLPSLRVPKRFKTSQEVFSSSLGPRQAPKAFGDLAGMAVGERRRRSSSGKR
eukprot:TRINITY_DN13990_c0_g1_i1.p1 TRINITY_DN13990_c0_g1~~TRINITY_DN13990_c0_g1_i1.p1  ORF type:complete len:502 (+),score=116.39 TRINITY_DN13990_c0_g1_i1:89-1507(+)